MNRGRKRSRVPSSDFGTFLPEGEGYQSWPSLVVSFPSRSPVIGVVPMTRWIAFLSILTAACANPTSGTSVVTASQVRSARSALVAGRTTEPRIEMTAALQSDGGESVLHMQLRNVPS